MTSCYVWQKSLAKCLPKTRLERWVCLISAPLCLSDVLRGWDQTEWRPGGLEWSCSFLLPRCWPGGYWGIPAGAFPGGPACSRPYDHNGPTNTHTLPPRYQDHRLAWWGWWWMCGASLFSCIWLDHVSCFPQKIAGQVSMHISGIAVLTLLTRNTKS